MQIHFLAPMILYFPANLIIATHNKFLFSVFVVLTNISGQQRPTTTNDDEQKYSPTKMQVNETRKRRLDIESETTSIRPQLRRTDFGRIESSHRPEPRSERTNGFPPNKREHHGDLVPPLHELIHRRRSRKKSLHLHLGS